MRKSFLMAIKVTVLALLLGACNTAADSTSTDEEVGLSIAFEVPSESGSATLSSSFPNPEAGIVGCSFQVDRPHKSTHVPGMVNVVAWIQCNRPVQRIEISLGLARDGVERNSNTFFNTGQAYLQGNVAVPCVSGTYNGAANATVTFPPGAIPPVGYGSAGSGDVPITC